MQNWMGRLAELAELCLNRRTMTSRDVETREVETDQRPIRDEPGHVRVIDPLGHPFRASLSRHGSAVVR